MIADEKLAAILAAVQTDPGNRGLARDPHDNLFTATAGDFAAACRGIAEHPAAGIAIATGFYIAAANPPAFETDGPLGAIFLIRALAGLGIPAGLLTEAAVMRSARGGMAAAGACEEWVRDFDISHFVALERAGPAADEHYYTMRGVRSTAPHLQWDTFLEQFRRPPEGTATVGIGDGGNEIGMGKIPHETIVKNIPNGDLIHCRVPTDHLIVAGVSNWGAYALAAGVYVLRGVKPAADLFDHDREREILEVMVREGPLVDGVTGEQTATVDGLTWDEYVKPLVRIREILEA
jgi:hypothetical protein